jgi:hypothetical protein
LLNQIHAHLKLGDTCEAYLLWLAVLFPYLSTKYVELTAGESTVSSRFIHSIKEQTKPLIPILRRI